MSRPARFQGKVVIVTGAAQGIGRGVAIAVAAEGGTVLAVDRSELVREVVGEIENIGGTAASHEADLETYAGAAGMVDDALRRWGRVDILINKSAGRSGRSRTSTTSKSKSRRRFAARCSNPGGRAGRAAAYGRAKEGRHRQRVLDRNAWRPSCALRSRERASMH
jgi:NAD(P)-dependent dehydrogenase (short-subunit alcohol dehydrogenase family)